MRNEILFGKRWEGLEYTEDLVSDISEFSGRLWH